MGAELAIARGQNAQATVAPKSSFCRTRAPFSAVKSPCASGLGSLRPDLDKPRLHQHLLQPDGLPLPLIGNRFDMCNTPLPAIPPLVDRIDDDWAPDPRPQRIAQGRHLDQRRCTDIRQPQAVSALRPRLIENRKASFIIDPAEERAFRHSPPAGVSKRIGTGRTDRPRHREKKQRQEASSQHRKPAIGACDVEQMRPNSSVWRPRLALRRKALQSRSHRVQHSPKHATRHLCRPWRLQTRTGAFRPRSSAG